METTKENSKKQEKTTKKTAERKIQLSVSALEEMEKTEGLLKQFLLAHKENPEAIAPILLAEARGAIRQLQLTV